MIEQFTRYELLEQTHEQIMKLPLVVKELQSNINNTGNNSESNNKDLHYLENKLTT